MSLSCCQATESDDGTSPVERVTPDLVFNRVGVDYVGPPQLKLGST